MSTETIEQFLRARIAEDEASTNPLLHLPARVGGEKVARRIWAASKARREIVDYFDDPDFDYYPLDQVRRVTLRSLAVEYADHPDFRKEWAR